MMSKRKGLAFLSQSQRSLINIEEFGFFRPTTALELFHLIKIGRLVFLANEILGRDLGIAPKHHGMGNRYGGISKRI